MSALSYIKMYTKNKCTLLAFFFIVEPEKPDVAIWKKTSTSAVVTWTKPVIPTGLTYYIVNATDLVDENQTVPPCKTKTAFWQGI